LPLIPAAGITSGVELFALESVCDALAHQLEYVVEIL
jgi:hypothetical protein